MECLAIFVATVETVFNSAQREFAKVGFRPVDSGVIKETQKQYPTIGKLYTVKEFGGWDAIQKKFFDDQAIFDQIQGGR